MLKNIFGGQIVATDFFKGARPPRTPSLATCLLIINKCKCTIVQITINFHYFWFSLLFMYLLDTKFLQLSFVTKLNYNARYGIFFLYILVRNEIQS